MIGVHGVGLLADDYDDDEPHVVEVLRSANHFECKSMSIGTRSQSGPIWRNI